MRASKRLLPLVLGAGLAACASTPSPVATGTDTAWYGNLSSGGKFGTTIGQSAATAEGTLWANGYGFEGATGCAADTHSLLACQSGAQYLVFQPVEIGRKGHVYLKIEQDRVAQIGWSFTPVAYLDM